MSEKHKDGDKDGSAGRDGDSGEERLKGARVPDKRIHEVVDSVPPPKVKKPEGG